MGRIVYDFRKAAWWPTKGGEQERFLPHISSSCVVGGTAQTLAYVIDGLMSRLLLYSFSYLFRKHVLNNLYKSHMVQREINTARARSTRQQMKHQ